MQSINSFSWQEKRLLYGMAAHMEGEMSLDDYTKTDVIKDTRKSLGGLKEKVNAFLQDKTQNTELAKLLQGQSELTPTNTVYLQTALVKLGFNPRANIDGVFAPASQRAQNILKQAKDNHININGPNKLKDFVASIANKISTTQKAVFDFQLKYMGPQEADGLPGPKTFKKIADVLLMQTTKAPVKQGAFSEFKFVPMVEPA